MDPSSPLAQIRIENLSRVVLIWKNGRAALEELTPEVFGSGLAVRENRNAAGEITINTILNSHVLVSMNADLQVSRVRRPILRPFIPIDNRGLIIDAQAFRMRVPYNDVIILLTLSTLPVPRNKWTCFVYVPIQGIWQLYISFNCTEPKTALAKSHERASHSGW